ncbi:MAG: cytochrome c [Proteobacteria bacterium]|nr:cytochrome c [Pseudomonadota bacterium]
MLRPVALSIGALLLLLVALPDSFGQDPEAAGDDDDSAAPAVVEAPPVPVEPLPADTLVADLLVQLGEAAPAHWLEADEAMVTRGREIIHEGRTTTPEGKRSRVASPGYLCTDCHNTVREDPDLMASDPEARMAYAVENDLPFLPGTTLYGTVNRTSWFNEDYVKKYGTLVEPANRALRMALLLCSAECSQGRVMDEWELDAMQAYLWTLGYQLSDLELSEEQHQLIARAVDDEALRSDAIAALQGAYLPYSPAHVREAPADRMAGYGNDGDAARGADIYRRSCLTCHSSSGKGDPVRGEYHLKDSKGSIGELYRNRGKGNNLSFHQTITYGTRPFGVPIAYMPFFTQERLSDQQVDDLQAYFEQTLGVE